VPKNTKQATIAADGEQDQPEVRKCGRHHRTLARHHHLERPGENGDVVGDGADQHQRERELRRMSAWRDATSAASSTESGVEHATLEKMIQKISMSMPCAVSTW